MAPLLTQAAPPESTDEPQANSDAASGGASAADDGQPPANEAELSQDLTNLAGDARQDALNAFEGLTQGDFAAAWPLFEKYLLPLVLAIVILIVTFVVAKIASRWVGAMIRRAKVEETLARFFGKLAFYVVVVLGVLAALQFVGIQVTGFAAILASVGFAVGMALSGTLSNFASGVMLLVFRPFKVGDVVSAAGVTAKVNAIELFTTTFDTFDNRRFIVPNSEIFGGIIENVTFHRERRVDVSVGCDYAADLDRTREVLTGAAESLKEKLLEGEGRGFQVYLNELGDSSVAWVVRFWCQADDYWAVKEELTRAVKTHLDDAKIGIPFPQMDVHVDGKLAG